MDADKLLQESQQLSLSPRRYSVVEIDQMRVYIHAIIARNNIGHGYLQKDRDQETEMKLRTYLLAGVAPEELANA